MPVYLVTVQSSDTKTHLVDAPTKMSAVNHVANNLISVAPLSASELYPHIQAGHTVEKAEVKTKTPQNDAPQEE